MILFTCSSQDKTGGIHAFELSTGTQLFSFKNNICSSNATDIISSKSKMSGPMLISSQNDSPIVHIYNWSKAQPIHKFILPEKITCLCSLPVASFVILGGQSGRVYVYHLASGNLVKTFDAHLGKVRDIECFQDGSMFVTAGEDSLIHIWSMQDVLSLPHELLKPFRTLSEHRLPITKISCGYFSPNSTRLFSASMDKTIKISDAETAKCLLSIVFPFAVTSMIVNPCETFVIAGLSNGKIQKIDLNQDGKNQTQSLLNQDSKGMEDVSDTSGSFFGHRDQITSLALSLDSTMLVSGSKDQTVIIWDLSSYQALRTLSNIHKGAISHVSVMRKPVNFNDPNYPKANLPIIQPFQKFSISQDVLPRVQMVYSQTNSHKTEKMNSNMMMDDWASLLSSQAEESNHRNYQNNEISSSSSSYKCISDSNKVTESDSHKSLMADTISSVNSQSSSETELQKLRNEKLRLQKLNLELYNACVTNFISSN